MRFQILDSTRTPMSINDIDAEVANFWGVPVKKEDYASPLHWTEEEEKSMSMRDRFNLMSLQSAFNWYDCIGFKIAASPTGEVSPISVYEKLEEVFDYNTKSPLIEKLYELLAYWEEKGYTLMSL